MEDHRTYPAGLAIAELYPILAHYSIVVGKRPDQTVQCMAELASSLELTAKSIRRGFVTENQLVDLRRRCRYMEKQANA